MPFHPNDLSTGERRRPATHHRRTFPPSVPAAIVCADNSGITAARRRTLMAPLIRFTATDSRPSSSPCSSKSSSTVSLAPMTLPATPPPAYHAAGAVPPKCEQDGPLHLTRDDDDEMPLSELKHLLLHAKDVHP